MKALFSSKKGYLGGGERFGSIIMGVIAIAGGILPLLVQFKVIEKLPAIPTIALSALLIITGIVLIIDMFKAAS